MGEEGFALGGSGVLSLRIGEGGNWGGGAGAGVLFLGCLGVGLRFAVRLLWAWGGCWMLRIFGSRSGIASRSGFLISAVACDLFGR